MGQPGGMEREQASAGTARLRRLALPDKKAAALYRGVVGDISEAFAGGPYLMPVCRALLHPLGSHRMLALLFAAAL